MTGPEHYLEGDRLMKRASTMIEGSEGRARTATEAHAHYTAALVACLATSQLPEYVAWDQAIKDTSTTGDTP
ncbi:hypothetical protein GCM10018980_52010 [Streptomyces capoamus]|uniref:Uncharacterized protein n=1 Tax=Streptomyces capoamus TaxID=68183 RepID=A0A919EZF3_9ACTN|nr:hypothetical protein [Streptomyces capoamus]GGW15730.1 hypothetical protein GCM10010501_28810 [Streptomyces libani subsp. rufus]GHG62231.1 hypothetical protein GCM10018980_52010 [Streptomyces capoamus]